MTEQRNMEMNAENENESECIEQRILKMRAEIVAIEKEIAEIRKESKRHSAKMKAETDAIREESERRSAKMKAESDAIRKEADAKWNKTNQTLAELAETDKRHGEQIGGYGNQIGDFTESLAMASIRRIFDQRFNADFQGRVNLNLKEQDCPLEVDAWGISRNGTKEVYLVEIKRKFKHEHINQVRQLVKRFRSYFPNYSDSPIYPVITAVKISDIDRRKLWEMGMYVIDITDGVFKLAKPPAEIEFEPKGGYGMTTGVQRAVPPLNLVWNRESEQRKVQ